MAGTVTVVAVHPQKGQSASDCQAMAQAGAGGFSYDEFGTACWSVYGKAIQINPIMNSVMEGAMITNINFNAVAIPAVASPQKLAGASSSSPSQGLGSPGYTSEGSGSSSGILNLGT